MTTETPNDAGEQAHLAALRLFVLTAYRPLTRHALRPLVALLSRGRA